MEAFDNQALVIFSAVLPILIAIVKQSNLSPQANALIAFACYIVVGVAGAFVASGGVPTTETLVDFIASVTVIGTVAYKLFWSNLGVTSENAPSVEERLTEATSIGG